MKNAARKNILKIKPYVPGKPIEEVKRDLGLKEVCKLASNENPFSPSPKVLKAMQKALKGLNRYPDGSCYYLRKEIAKNLKVKETQLIFGNGSDEVIFQVVRAFVNEGEEIVIAHPTFLMYGIVGQIAGAKIKTIPLKNFRYDLVAMKKAVSKKTKVIFIANPDNPMGTYVTKKELDVFLKGLRKDILVFLDEAYYEFAPKKDYPNSFSLLKKYKNIIVTRTFSKMYGLAGLRIGYGVSSEEVIDILNRVREPFNINSVAQAAAVAALKDQAYYQKAIRLCEKEKQYLYEEFKKFGLSFVKSATNFVVIDVKKDSQKVFQKLLRKGIIVRNMNAWGLKNYIRVTVGKPQENRKFIRSLKEIL
ncbi:MAG: histidinol-phosphate transaminase [Candidatus Aceula meridiana]|nr:histidinol-phosphate transaminase [Candidatus Aceula meridiana]